MAAGTPRGLAHPAVQHCGEVLENIIPMVVHIDGVESFTNSDTIVFSFSSALNSKGHVFDAKFLCGAVQSSWVMTKPLLRGMHKSFAEILGWSFRCGLEGRMPIHGPKGPADIFEAGTSRARAAGQAYPGGWRCCFIGLKQDRKQRVETHGEKKWYKCKLICEECMAVQTFKNRRLRGKGSFCCCSIE